MTLPADLGIVVVNHGHPDLLERNLLGIGREARSGRVVVVDNFTGPAQREATTALCEREGWLLIAPALDLGFAAAVNAGVRLLRSRGCLRLLILSPEVSIGLPGVLALAEGCSADPQRIQGARITEPNGSLWFGGGTVNARLGREPGHADPHGRGPGDWVTWACLMIHASFWDWLEGADEDYFRYWEDVDLSWRCVAAGGVVAVRTDITALRRPRGSHAGVELSTLDLYSVCRNRLAFAARHVSAGRVWVWLLFSPEYAVRMVIRGLRRQERPGGKGTAGMLLVAAGRGTGAGAVIALRALDPRRSRTGRPGPRGGTARTAGRPR